ncbi:MAG: hypothetical protein ACI9TA_000068 [Reinekea sp.]|jgi:hypothetical protein
MKRTRTFPFLMIIAALLLAVTSVGSAARMAPSDIDQPQVAAFLAMGGTLDDICGDDFHDHAMSCPFCHVTADVGPVKPASRVWQLATVDQKTGLMDLTHGDQRFRTQRSARGPPAVA